MRIVQWDYKKTAGGSVMVQMSQQEAITLARSLLAQIETNDCITHRAEFQNVEFDRQTKTSRGSRWALNRTHLSMSVFPNPVKISSTEPETAT